MKFKILKRIVGGFVKRYKIIAKYAYGKILDVGYVQQPNEFLKGDTIGFDKNLPKQKT